MGGSMPESEMTTNSSHWYALQIQTRLANVAAATLQGKGFEQFLPVYSSRRRWSDRVKVIQLPLFPGYLFCRLDLSDRLVPVLTTPGVIGFVGVGKTPIPIAAEEIDAVKRVVQSGLTAQPWPYLPVGTRVAVDGGPLAGIQGIVASADKVSRLVVSVSLLQRSVAVEIDREWARPLDGPVGSYAPAPTVSLIARA
jgi:transcription antitermination factor NusG